MQLSKNVGGAFSQQNDSSHATFSRNKNNPKLCFLPNLTTKRYPTKLTKKGESQPLSLPRGKFTPSKKRPKKRSPDCFGLLFYVVEPSKANVSLKKSGNNYYSHKQLLNFLEKFDLAKFEEK